MQTSAPSPQPRVAPALSQLLGDVKDALIDGLNRRLSEAGYAEISTAHGAVFRHLPSTGARLSELAGAARMTKQSMGEHVLELERLGYLIRVPDPDDGRAKLIRPTRKGLSTMMFAREALREIEEQWAEAIGAERIAELRETLEAIRTLRSAAQ